MTNKYTLVSRGFSVNGKADLQGVAVVHEDGKPNGLEWSGNLSVDTQYSRFIKWLCKALGVEAHEADRMAREFVKALQERRAAAEQQSEQQEETKPPTVRLLDEAPPMLTRPLALINGRAYAATWLWAEITTSNPPTTSLEKQLFIIRDDGQMFGPREHDSLGISTNLPDIPPDSKLWRTSGVKAFCTGQRPDYPGVFNRQVSVYDRYIDFSRSFASQQDMCELSACFSLATWFTPALTVIGYPWPNGEKGSGKTQWGVCWANTSYLGMVVLASASFAALRDLADYGAAMLFDDAETLGDPKRSDPDKRALFLAGNCRGAQVPIKEPSPEGRGWQTKWINAFCPRGFTAISLPDPVLGSRSIRIPLVRTADPRKGNADPGDLHRWPCDQEKLQDDLWATALSLMVEATQISGDLDNEVSLVGREFEPWRAILTVARLFERHGVQGLEERMRRVMQAYQEEKADNDTNDRATQVLKAILYQYLNTTDTDVLDVPDVSDVLLEAYPNIVVSLQETSEVIKSFGVEEGFDTEWVSPKTVGWQLKALRFGAERDTKTKKRARSRTIPREAFIGLCLAYGVIKISAVGNNKTSDLSETSGNDDSLDPVPAESPAPQNPNSGSTGVGIPTQSKETPEDTLPEAEIFTDSQKAEHQTSFDLDGVATGEAAAPTTRFKVPQTMERVRELAVKYQQEQRLYVDIETYALDPTQSLDPEKPALDPHNATIRLLQITTEDGQTDIFDFYILLISEALATLRPCLEGGPIKVGHNIAMFEGQFFLAQGYALRPVFDTQIADQLIRSATTPGYKLAKAGDEEPEEMAFRSLKELVFEYLGKDMNKELQTSDFGEAELSPAQYDYAAKDSYTLLPLHSVLEQRIQELELTEVMEVENEAALALAETAFRGVKITEEAWNAVASDLALEKVKFEATLHQMAVDDKASYIPDNWGSPDQKKLFLSELMGWSLTSVAEPILKELEDKDPIIPVMMAHQKVKTGLERYGPNWLGKISRVTERVHPDWHPIGAVTGRQSCSNPPMQQIKRGSLYRKLFVAEENNMVARCDLPAIEARIMAEYSEDEKMINIFLEGRDIHIETAAMVNGKDPQDINKDSIERQIAKTIRYLKGFGGGWWRLQQECKKMGINLNERAAREINAKFDREFPDFYKWQKAQGATAMSVSRLGRKRYLPDPPPGMNIRTAKGNKYSPYTQRLNSPVQGTGADIIKLCLIELMRTRTSELAGWGPIVVSHDEIAVEGPKAAKDAAVEWLRNAMLVGANKILKRVPLKAHELEVKIGANYTCE